MPSSTVRAGAEALVIRHEDSLRDALVRQRVNGAGLVVVVADDGTVLGTVTDERIRRAVLCGTDLDTALTDVRLEPAVLAEVGMTDDELVQLLRTHRLRSVPVVAAGKLVDVRSLDGFPDPRAAPRAVIMVGGRGERLRPLTDKVPKPLLRIGSRSIVERLIQGVRAAGIQDVCLAVNYMADVFERRLGRGDELGVALEYLREEEPMGTAGALSLLPPGRKGPIVVSNGDIVTTLDFARLLDFHWHHQAAVTVAAVEYRSPIPYGVLHATDHRLLAIEEKPYRSDLCNAGMYVLEPEVLELLQGRVPLGMPDLITDVIAQGMPVHVFPVVEKWFDVGGTAEFERVLVDFAVGEDN